MTVPSEQKHCHLQRKEIIPPIIKVHTHSGEALSEPPQNPIGDVLLYTVFTTGNISANRPLFTSISVNTPTAKARWLPIL